MFPRRADLAVVPGKADTAGRQSEDDAQLPHRGSGGSIDAERPQLEAAIDFAREGDVLVITKIDRIARSVANLCEIEAKLHAKGASLKVLTPQLDTSTSIGRLVFNMVGAIAQFEREIMLERQREGIAKAKARPEARPGQRR